MRAAVERRLSRATCTVTNVGLVVVGLVLLFLMAYHASQADRLTTQQRHSVPVCTDHKDTVLLVVWPNAGCFGGCSGHIEVCVRRADAAVSAESEVPELLNIKDAYRPRYVTPVEAGREAPFQPSTNNPLWYALMYAAALCAVIVVVLRNVHLACIGVGEGKV